MKNYMASFVLLKLSISHSQEVDDIQLQSLAVDLQPGVDLWHSMCITFQLKETALIRPDNFRERDTS